MSMYFLAALLAAAPPSATIERDAGTGWNLVVLRHGDLQARIAPEAGANLFSFQVAGQELLLQPQSLKELAQQRAGMPVLFPTPNRVRDAVMTFEGQTFRFKANNQNNFIHGLARTRAWTARPPRASATEASVALVLDWDEHQPDFALFPIKHRLTVTYTVFQHGLRIAYQVDDLDRRRLPYGFGLHPYFRIPGDRKDVTITVPLAERMEAVDLLPTGKLLPVAGTPYDLRRPTSLEGLSLDDVYFGLSPEKKPSFRLGNLEVTLVASKEFTHLVVFTPKGRPLFALEDQTCSTDAHNLWAQGKKRESHLLVVPPGGTQRGQVEWRITTVR
jgi:aldose 1-epimerase